MSVFIGNSDPNIINSSFYKLLNDSIVDSDIIDSNYSSSNSNSSNHNSTHGKDVKNDAAILRNTFAVYGSIWLFVILFFSYIRQKWKKPYSIRHWVPEYHTILADNPFGCLSWIWHVYQVDDTTLMLECGMDATCLVRILRMGFRIACVGTFNAMWLMPLYKFSPPLKKDPITDRIAQFTVANVPEESERLLATVAASYILFGAIMYLIHHEFNWFIHLRHKFLALPLVRNYSVFVRNIPRAYCDNAGVELFFRECFTNHAVVHEAQLRVKTPELSKWVKRREKLLHKLDHAVAYQEKTGKVPQHKTKMCGEKVDSIITYAVELKELNEKIRRRIEEIENERAERRRQRELNHDSLGLEHSKHSNTNSQHQDIFHKASSNVKDAAKTATEAAATAIHKAGKLINGREDGEVCRSGFLTFSTLRARHAALQIVHHSEPFRMEVMEAPQPDDGTYVLLEVKLCST
jgi:hypothetical protein